MYMKTTHSSRESIKKMPVYINGSHKRDIHPCGATHMFHHSQWGATSINHQKYPSNM